MSYKSFLLFSCDSFLRSFERKQCLSRKYLPIREEELFCSSSSWCKCQWVYQPGYIQICKLHIVGSQKLFKIYLWATRLNNSETTGSKATGCERSYIFFVSRFYAEVLFAKFYLPTFITVLKESIYAGYILRCLCVLGEKGGGGGGGWGSSWVGTGALSCPALCKVVKVPLRLANAVHILTPVRGF